MKEKLAAEILALEQSDERLFTNGNGNLARYRALQAELAVLSAKWQRTQVMCVETGEIYDSAAAACTALGCGKSAMSNHLSGRFPHLRGLHFKRVEK